MKFWLVLLILGASIDCIAQGDSLSIAWANTEKSYDEFTGKSSIHHNYWIKRTSSITWKGNGVFLCPSIHIAKDSAIRIYLLTKFQGPDWIFAERIILLADGQARELALSSVKRHVLSGASGYIYEKHLASLSESDIEYLKLFVRAPSPKAKLYGSKGAKEHTLTTTDISAIRDMLLIYESLP